MCIFNVYSLFSIAPVVLVVAVVAVVAGLVILLVLYYSKFLLEHNTMIDLTTIPVPFYVYLLV